MRAPRPRRDPRAAGGAGAAPPVPPRPCTAARAPVDSTAGRAQPSAGCAPTRTAGRGRAHAARPGGATGAGWRAHVDCQSTARACHAGQRRRSRAACWAQHTTARRARTVDVASPPPVGRRNRRNCRRRGRHRSGRTRGRPGTRAYPRPTRRRSPRLGRGHRAQSVAAWQERLQAGCATGAG
eukprot:scaffold28272_cov101-Isochrysis_galbana.AAC.2